MIERSKTELLMHISGYRIWIWILFRVSKFGFFFLDRLGLGQSSPTSKGKEAKEENEMHCCLFVIWLKIIISVFCLAFVLRCVDPNNMFKLIPNAFLFGLIFTYLFFRIFLLYSSPCIWYSVDNLFLLQIFFFAQLE